ncbi:amidohydrolase family protein [Yimella sp. cx-51]|uniref:amidohydrolase family protein n=1 Tax=Yimella sp. cx-51 TaxID=2770551 RepID=UPI00165DC304|nr:amidohydrolase family protein [Yimella sp. cx-51]MBC9955483.1 amidohydrolase [Yimella sp. cx-51]QTH37931.1 amidohydrolase [Yimella sp. cx-51]
MITAPRTDDEVPAYLSRLGIPGLADVHVHFMPDAVLNKVWNYFDHADTNYGLTWPITYRLPEADRIERLRALGVQRIVSLNYAHKAGMAKWLNEWNAQFAARVAGAVHSATFYPEPGVADYVEHALDAGARIWKVHVSVGGFTPEDPLLEAAWRLIDQAGTPVVIHAGSGPLAGEFTGPEPVRRLLERHPRLPLVIAHLGMPEYDAFADLAQQYERVHLDTTMVATDFTERIAPMPPGYVDRLGALVDKVVLGSDFPNIPYAYAHQIEALARLGLGDEWMRKVLWHNGMHLLDW